MTWMRSPAAPRGIRDDDSTHPSVGVLTYPRSVQLTIRVKPGSRRGPLVEDTTEGLLVHVRERAVDGAANSGVEKALAAHFGVAPRDVRILRGHTARTKRVEVDA